MCVRPSFGRENREIFEASWQELGLELGLVLKPGERQPHSTLYKRLPVGRENGMCGGYGAHH